MFTRSGIWDFRSRVNIPDLQHCPKSFNFKPCKIKYQVNPRLPVSLWIAENPVKKLLQRPDMEWMTNSLTINQATDTGIFIPQKG
jgi:hypothetical protein